MLVNLVPAQVCTCPEHKTTPDLLAHVVRTGAVKPFLVHGQTFRSELLFLQMEIKLVAYLNSIKIKIFTKCRDEQERPMKLSIYRGRANIT